MNTFVAIVLLLAAVCYLLEAWDQWEAGERHWFLISLICFIGALGWFN